MGCECCLVLDAPIQTLAAEDTQFNFGHVEPTAMLGRVMKVQAAQPPLRFHWGKRGVEQSRDIGVEIVQDPGEKDI
jgi:hypothetical protein